jgi:hypothetical protein
MSDFSLDGIDILYHGSTEEVKFPNVYHSSPRRDFGRGFYLTQNREEAYDWALIRSRQFSAQAYLNRYKLSKLPNVTVKFFDKDSTEDLILWIDYILYNRGYLEFAPTDPLGEVAYDIIVGPIADNVLAQAFDDLISYRVPGQTLREVKTNFIGYLAIDRLDNQLCFKTKLAEKALRFIGAERCY